MTDDMTPAEFARLFKRFTFWLDDEYFERETSEDRKFIGDRLRAFIGDIHEIPAMATVMVSERDIPNVHVALTAWLERPGRSHELAGWLADTDFGDTGLTQIMRASGFSRMQEGPPRYRTLDLAEGAVSCLVSGLYLVHDGPQRAVICVTLRDRFHSEDIRVDVASLDAAHAESVVLELKEQLKVHNVYRGQVLSLVGDGTKLRFHTITAPERDAVILSEGLLETIERNTVRFSARASELRAANRHLRRGILFHGPPGTGKSMTIQHLIAAMPGRTTFLVTAEDLGGIKETCDMARALEPSTVIIEDVDLVARSRKDEDANYPALFRLMNEMDGIGQDADVMFILTTNRPEVIEPALAARPGRIDQAILFPLPDEGCRDRLVRLYARGLVLDEATITEMIRRTAGASASFIRELLRKATLFAVERSAPAGTLGREDLDGALREMVLSGGELGTKLLGGSQRSAGFNRPADL